MFRDPRCDPYGWPNARWHHPQCKCYANLILNRFCECMDDDEKEKD